MNINNEIKNIEQKIDFIKSRGFLISNEEEIKIYLDKICLFNLSKYFKNFKQDNTEDFIELIKFYLFDQELRKISFLILEEIEVNFITILVKIIGEKYNDCSIYKNKFSENRINFINDKINGYKLKADKFFNSLTFGELVKLFRDLKVIYKKKIVKEFKFRDVDIFENWIFCMRHLRNLVCHHENIFNKSFNEIIKGRKIQQKFDKKFLNSFILYLVVLEIFILKLKIKTNYLKNIQKSIEKFNINKKSHPVLEHISKIDIEAWGELIQQLYSSFIISQEKKEFFEKNKENNKKIILITGGTGYIGSHGVVAFEQAGYKTVIVDNLSNSSLEALDGIEKILGYKPDFFEVDLRDKEKLKDIFEKYSFDGVIHFAGLKAVGESCEKPLEYFDNNIVGSLKLFELMQEFQVKNIVFSSSATVYDPENSSPFFENMHTGNTTNPYGTTKFILEQILRDLAKFSSFRVTNLRYFNPIGAHSSGEIGEDPAGIPNNLLPFIMKVATGELKELQVFGDDYNTIDGTGVRDYIDVVDLIDGHLKAYELVESKKLKVESNGIFETYNLGVGKGVSVLEMVEVARKVTGKKIPYKIVERRAGDLAEVYCNPEKAKKELDWEAKTSLEDSIKNSWKFYNKK